MNIGIHDYNDFNNKDNLIFSASNYSIGDNLHAPALSLRNTLASMGHELSTLDTHPMATYKKVLFFDMPASHQVNLEELQAQGLELYLVMLESSIIRTENHDVSKHRFFKKIFTWDDTLVDGKRYIKIQISHQIPPCPEPDKESRDKFCCLIAGNKRSKMPGQLYSERKRSVRWFEQNHPDKFDLFGFGWDSYEFPGIRPIRFLNRFPLLKKLCAPRYPSYRGPVDSKAAVLREYRFSLCYENVSGIQGYITEKIFDSLFALCIPVYWGAPDIGRYIPELCFIDRSQFKDTKELFSYMHSMSEAEYEQRLEAMISFLRGEEIKAFSCDTFATTIIAQLGLDT